MDKRQIFLTAAALCLNMSISAQRENLQNVTVKQALNKLQQTCGYSFVYEAKDLTPANVFQSMHTIVQKLLDKSLEVKV